MKSAEEENKPEPGRSTHQPLGVEKYVKPHENKKFATFNHAQLTVSWDFGQDGRIAQRHVEVVLPEEQEMSSSLLKTEEKIAQIAKKPAHVIFNPAQLTV